MADGADKAIFFDPPGAIGLPADGAIVLLRFDEAEDSIPPKDDAGTLQDLGDAVGISPPSVTNAVLGRGRQFDAATPSGFVSADIVSGGSLLTRSMTIQVVLSWDAAGQDAAGSEPCTIVARGKGTSAAEYLAYALEIDLVDLGNSVGELRWVWQDLSGVDHIQTGAQFRIVPGNFTMLTATRRWVSPTEVFLRYYIGDLLIGEVTSADGEIGGGTTGTFQVGARFFSTVFGNAFAGVMDEVLILDRELTREEIEATWLRITQLQPLGYQLLREMHDRGFPLPTDPGSDVQLDLRMIGNSMGYAAARAEDVRQNILPQHAYGSTLEDWETAVRVTPKPSDGIDERRERVLAKIRQRRGCSIPGLEDALQGLLGEGTVDDLEFIAFSNEIDDDFAAIDPQRWDVLPNGGGGAISVVSGAASFQPGAGTFLMDGTTRDWITMRETVGGDGKQAHQLVKLVWTTPQSNAEAGIYFGNSATGDYLLVGLRDVGGSFRVHTESFIANVSQGTVLQATLGANPAAIWLHLFQTTTDGTWRAAWSVTSGTAGFTESADIAHPTSAHWAGCYLRTTAAVGAGPRADFDDHRLLAPFSGRALNAYVLLDRDLGFAPDIDGADSVVQSIRHAFTHACFITDPSFLSDDPDSRTDCSATGGY